MSCKTRPHIAGAALNTGRPSTQVSLERGGEPWYGADGGRELLVEQQLRQLLVLGAEDLQDGGDEVSELLQPLMPCYNPSTGSLHPLTLSSHHMKRPSSAALASWLKPCV